MDKKKALKKIKDGSITFDETSNELKSDKEFVLAAMQIQDYILQDLDNHLINDKDIILAALNESELLIRFAGENIRSDRIFMEKNISDKSLFKEFFINKDEELKLEVKSKKNIGLNYKYKISIKGSGGSQRAGTIEKSAYDYFFENNELLIDHVVNSKKVSAKALIGDWYDCTDIHESDGFDFKECSVNIKGNDESFNFKVHEKDLKKFGIKLIRKTNFLEDYVKPGEVGYFIYGRKNQNGHSNDMLEIDEPFDIKKLEIHTHSFQSREMIVKIKYGCGDIECLIEASEDDYDFDVYKIKSS